MGPDDSENVVVDYQWKAFVLTDAQSELHVNRHRPPMFIDRTSRTSLWRACTALSLSEEGIPAQACRIIEFYIGEKVREFMKSKPSEPQYFEYRTSLNNMFPRNMAAAIIIATHLYDNTKTINAEIIVEYLRDEEAVTDYDSDQIKEAVGELIDVHVVKFPMWSTVQTAELIATFAGIPATAFHLMKAVVNVAEFMRYRLDVDLRQSLSVNIFGTDRVSSLKLAAASVYTAAKHLGLDTPHTLTLLAYFTSTTKIYILSLANLLLYYTEVESSS